MRRLRLLLLPFLAACAPAAATTAGSPTPAPQATAPSPGIVGGDYSVTLGEGDLPAATAPELRGRAAGAWVMAFHEGNHFVGTMNGRQVIEGPYRVSGGQVMFATGESGPYACNTPATYDVRTSNGRTVFALVGTDACATRLLVMTTRPFTRAP